MLRLKAAIFPCLAESGQTFHHHSFAYTPYLNPCTRLGAIEDLAGYDAILFGAPSNRPSLHTTVQHYGDLAINDGDLARVWTRRRPDRS